MVISNVQLRREAVAKLQNGFFCIYCNVKDNLVIDHLIPTAKGGTDNIKNLVLACGKCNNKKLAWSDKDLRRLGHDYIADKVIEIQQKRLHLTLVKIKELLSTDIRYGRTRYNRLQQFIEPSPLGNFIRELMYERQLSQHTLRKRIGCSGWYISRAISGERHPGPAYLKKIAEALDEPIESFLEYIDVRKTKNKVVPELNKEIMYEFWRQGKTITDVSREIKVDKSSFNHWLRGRKIIYPFYLEELTLLAEVLGWPLEKLKNQLNVVESSKSSSMLKKREESKSNKAYTYTKYRSYKKFWKEKPEYKKNRDLFFRKVKNYYLSVNPAKSMKTLASLMDLSVTGIYQYTNAYRNLNFIAPLFRILQISKILDIPYKVLPGEIFGQQQLEWQNNLKKIVKDKGMTMSTLGELIAESMRCRPMTFQNYISNERNIPEPFIHKICDFLDIPLPVLDMTDIEKELFDKNSI